MLHAGSLRLQDRPGSRTETRPAGAPRVLESPVDLEGQECPEQLLVDHEKLLVLGGRDRREPRREWLLDELQGARLDAAMGSCFIQVRARDQWLDVIRFPGGPDGAIAEVVGQVNARCGANQSGRPVNKAPGRESPDEPGAPSTRGWRAARRIAAILKPFRPGVLLLLALSFVAVAVDVAPPMLQRLLVDRVLQADQTNPAQQPLMFLLAIVAGLLIFRVAGTLVAIWKGIVSSRIGTMLTADLRDTLVKKLNELPLAFHNRQQVGALMSRVAYDTETMHTLIYHITGGFLLQSLQLVGIGVMLLYLNPKLALITMLPMPLILAGSWYFTRYLNPRNNHYWEAVGKQASSLMGMLSGIRVVKAFVQEDREIRRFHDVSARLRDSRQTVDYSTSTFSALMGFVFGLGGLAVWYLGGRDVLAGTMTLGSLMAFIAYLAMFYTPLTTITESTTWLSSFFITCVRIFELLDQPAARDDPDALQLDDVQGRIEFRDVSFAYDSSRPVLRQVSFAIQPGEMVGVVGRSGSGKSTLVSLIARLYDIDQGQILVDGHDVSRLSRRALRRRIGMVPQEPFLFRGSIADNIAYGVPGADPEQILQAAKYGDAHDFILRQPLAYETQLGEGGLGLSGGERQRLSIARALLFDPAILILDEATASIDAESERAICDAIRRFSRRRTTIVIAHRLSTLRDADRLLVFDQGRLLEEGTPAELLKRDGLYAALAKIQWNLSEGRQLAATAAGRRGAFDGPGNGDGNHHAHGGNPLDVVPETLLDSLAPGSEGNGSRRRAYDGEDRCELHWLDAALPVRVQGSGALAVEWRGRTREDIQAVAAFPASHPDRFISLRARDRWGAEAELGVIRDLARWPAEAQQAVRRSLARRYLLRRVDEIRQVRPAGHLLVLSALTPSGPVRIELEKTGQAFQAFGRHGVLLIDPGGACYLIPDRKALPKRQQRLLSLYLGD